MKDENILASVFFFHPSSFIFHPLNATAVHTLAVSQRATAAISEKNVQTQLTRRATPGEVQHLRLPTSG